MFPSPVVPSLVVPVFLSLGISVLQSPYVPVPNSSVVSLLPSLVSLLPSPVPGLSSLVVLSLVGTSLTCWLFFPNLVVPSPVFSAFPSLSVPVLNMTSGLKSSDLSSQHQGPVFLKVPSLVVLAPVVPQVLPLLSVLPVMATAILCVWASHIS